MATTAREDRMAATPRTRTTAVSGTRDSNPACNPTCPVGHHPATPSVPAPYNPSVPPCYPVCVPGGHYDDADFSADTMCCACGGGSLVTALTPTLTLTLALALTPTPTPTPTPNPTLTLTRHGAPAAAYTRRAQGGRAVQPHRAPAQGRLHFRRVRERQPCSSRGPGAAAQAERQATRRVRPAPRPASMTHGPNCVPVCLLTVSRKPSRCGCSW